MGNNNSTAAQEPNPSAKTTVELIELSEPKSQKTTNQESARVRIVESNPSRPQAGGVTLTRTRSRVSRVTTRPSRTTPPTPEEIRQAENGTLTLNTAFLAENHPLSCLMLISLRNSFVERKERKNLAEALPKIINLSRSSNESIQLAALQFLSSYSHAEEKKSTFLIDEGLVATCLKVISESSNKARVEVAALLLANLLKIGSRESLLHKGRLPSDMLSQLETTCLKFIDDREIMLVVMHCVCLASKFFTIYESLLVLTENFIENNNKLFQMTLNHLDVKRIFLSNHNPILKFGLFLIANCTLEESNWDSISFLIVKAIRKLQQQDRRSKDLIKKAMDKLDSHAPSVRTIQTEVNVEFIKGMIAGDIFIRLTEMGFPDEPVIQAIDMASLEEVNNFDIMVDLITQLISSIEAAAKMKSIRSIDELHSITFQLGDDCDPEPKLDLPYSDRVKMIEEIRHRADIRNRPGDLLLLSIIGVRHLTVKREAALETGLDYFNFLDSSECKRDIFIDFEGEEGLDYGGLKREFVHLICKEIEEKNNAVLKYFEVDEVLGCCYLSPLGKTENFLALGRLVGFSIIHNVPLPIRLSKAIFKLLQGQKLCYEDLDLISSDFRTGRVELIWKTDVEVLGEMNYELNYGATGETIPLIPNGGEIPITEDNKHQYAKDLVSSKLGGSMKQSLQTFISGIYDFIPKEIWRMYSIDEWSWIIHGQPFELEDIKKAVKYEECDETHEVVAWFWSIVESYSSEDVNKLMSRWTGYMAQPKTGFSLRIKLVKDYPPSAAVSVSTCAFQLKLPPAQTREQLETSLQYLMSENGETFTDR